MTSISVDEYRRRLAKRPAKRKPPRHREAQEQAEVVLWARARHDGDPKRWRDLDLLHCSLSGMPMTPAQAGRAKAQGMRAGIPDLCLPVPVGGFSGLYIEMKTDDGRPSKEQTEIIARLCGLGYRAVICYGAREAKQAILDYYASGETKDGE